MSSSSSVIGTRYCVVGLPFRLRKGESVSSPRIKALKTFLEEGYGIKLNTREFEPIVERKLTDKSVCYMLVGLEREPAAFMVNRLKRALNAVFYTYCDNYQRVMVSRKRLQYVPTT